MYYIYLILDWTQFNPKVIKIKKVKISSDLIKHHESRITKEKPFHSISNTEFCVELDKGRRFKHHTFFFIISAKKITTKIDENKKIIIIIKVKFIQFLKIRWKSYNTNFQTNYNIKLLYSKLWNEHIPMLTFFPLNWFKHYKVVIYQST